MIFDKKEIYCNFKFYGFLFDFPAKVKKFSTVLSHKDCVVLNNVEIEFGVEKSYKAQARNFWESKIKEIGMENTKKLREEICLKDNSPRIVSMVHHSNIESCFYYYDLFNELQAKITKFSETKYNSSFFFTIDSGLSRNSKTFENAKKYCEKILVKNGFQIVEL